MRLASKSRIVRSYKVLLGIENLHYSSMSYITSSSYFLTSPSSPSPHCLASHHHTYGYKNARSLRHFATWIYDLRFYFDHD